MVIERTDNNQLEKIMANYINFFPGDMRNEREFFCTEEPAYATEDLEGFVDSVIKGCTSSIGFDDPKGLMDALEDGALLAEWFGPQDDEEPTEEQVAQQEAVEEVHSAMEGLA